MSNMINPEAAEPSTTQASEQSDRNPQVTDWGGIESNGHQLFTPALSESLVTQPGSATSASAGLVNYDTGDSASSAQDEA
jgi:hypothetical protein